jgi:hypothetical protein
VDRRGPRVEVAPQRDDRTRIDHVASQRFLRLAQREGRARQEHCNRVASCEVVDRIERGVIQVIRSGEVPARCERACLRIRQLVGMDAHTHAQITGRL